MSNVAVMTVNLSLDEYARVATGASITALLHLKELK
jgi:hypothetical protein